MASEVELDVATRLLSKAQQIGWVATVRMGVRKALRPWLTWRHRAHVLRQPYRVEKQDLAAAFSFRAIDGQHGHAVSDFFE